MIQNPPPAPVAKKPRWKVHMAILGIINILLLIGVGVLSQQVTKQGETLQKLRTENYGRESQATNEVASQELKSAQERYAKILEAFPNEAQILEFVTDLDAIKRQGLISQFSFASDTPLKDKNGIYGLPVLIEMKGTGEQISEGLKALESLPTIINSVRIEIDTAEDGSKTMRYGGFLYVDQNFSQN